MTISEPQQRLLYTPNFRFISPLCGTSRLLLLLQASVRASTLAQICQLRSRGIFGICFCSPGKLSLPCIRSRMEMQCQDGMKFDGAGRFLRQSTGVSTELTEQAVACLFFRPECPSRRSEGRPPSSRSFHVV